MLDARDANGKRLPDEQRLTRVGRFLRALSLDEFPQLWNVLKGEMSLVGPRPERPCFVEEFQQEFPRYRERHRIQPGITGLAQIHGYYHSSPREKLRYDLMYLYHRSLWMDLWVLLRTASKTFLP
jgi:lipopolysaccharide/colanic/teichoic acid biosynthesis glycosyltransferase